MIGTLLEKVESVLKLDSKTLFVAPTVHTPQFSLAIKDEPEMGTIVETADILVAPYARISPDDIIGMNNLQQSLIRERTHFLPIIQLSIQSFSKEQRGILPWHFDISLGFQGFTEKIGTENIQTTTHIHRELTDQTISIPSPQNPIKTEQINPLIRIIRIRPYPNVLLAEKVADYEQKYVRGEVESNPTLDSLKTQITREQIVLMKNGEFQFPDLEFLNAAQDLAKRAKRQLLQFVGT